MNPSSQSCSNCRFVHRIGNYDWRCRRYPPVKDPAHLNGIWPVVSDYDWCGEWRETAEAHEAFMKKLHEEIESENKSCQTPGA